MSTRDTTQGVLNEGDRVKGTSKLARSIGTIREVDGWNALVDWDGGDMNGGETRWHQYSELKRI